MEIKLYNTLPTEAYDIRTAVFTDEQGFQAEFDDIDSRAKHLVLYDNAAPAAVCRVFESGTAGDYVIGRIAVVKSQRGKGFGAQILRAAETEIRRSGGKRALLHAQERAKDFYLKQEYLKTGKTDFDEDCPHIWMYKEL